MTTISPEAQRLIHQILEIGLNTPSEVADIFVRWSPHVLCLHVDGHAGGWSSGNASRPELSREVWLATTNSQPNDLRAVLTDLAAFVADCRATTSADRAAARKGGAE